MDKQQRYTLTFRDEDGHRERLTLDGPLCVAQWHASRLRKQRVTRSVIINRESEG